MASYYMVPLGDTMQSVVPAAARIESRRVFGIAAVPDALREATLGADGTRDNRGRSDAAR